jgi:hypothetical protein
MVVKRYFGRGECPVCHRTYALRRDGSVIRHVDVRLGQLGARPSCAGGHAQAAPGTAVDDTEP